MLLTIRCLSKRLPHNPFLRSWLARALFNTFSQCLRSMLYTVAIDCARRGQLLDPVSLSAALSEEDLGYDDFQGTVVIQASTLTLEG
jgi:hypothetical protein